MYFVIVVALLSPSLATASARPSRFPLAYPMRPAARVTFESPDVEERTTSKSAFLRTSLLSLRGGGGANDDFVAQAYDWCVNLGAPAALVAGAVVATLYENVRGGAMDVRKNDSAYARIAKKMTNVLLLSAFALQIVSIFVTTITGTMLLSKDLSHLTTTATTPLGFLKEHFEFEYLTSRLSFLQGLLNWLGGVALEHTVPRKGEGRAGREMDRFVATALGTLIVLLISFYNRHLTFYSNYADMIMTWVKVALDRFFGHYRPMMLVYVPGILWGTYTLYEALAPNVQEEESEE